MRPNTARNDADAIARFEGYLKVDPENVALRIDLGDLYHVAGRFAEARSCFASVLDDMPDHNVARSRLAGVAISEHSFQEAEAQLRTLYETQRNPVDTHNLGLAVVYQKRWDEALALFEEARDEGLSGVESQTYITRTLHQMGNFERAIDECKKLLEATGPGEIEGYLALLEGDAGIDMPAAQARARSVLERFPENADANIVVGTEYLEKQQLGQAERTFKRLTEKVPNNPRGWLGLGLAALMDLRHEDAIRYFGKTLELIPEDPATLIALGWVYISKMDGFTAEKIFRRAVAADPKVAEAHGGLAAALVHIFQFEEAERSIRRARALNKQNFGAAYALGVLMEMRGRHETAEKIFRAHLETRPREDGVTLMDAVNFGLARHMPPTPALEPPRPEDLNK